MTTTIKISVLPQTDEEFKAVEELLTKMREEKRKEKAIQENEKYLRNDVIAIIDAIGLEETKRIIRKINRELRG